MNEYIPDIEDNRPIIYKIGADRYWDVEKAAWIEPTDFGPASLLSDENSGKRLIELLPDGKAADEAYLIRTLRFYGFPLGELTDKCGDAIRDALTALDAKYLTPRVLAGLSQGDEYAQAQWQAHEAEAAPLRAKLAELEKE